MQNREDISPAEKALESALCQLKPAASTLNRDELMFNAGRASIGSKAPWQLFSGVLTILLLGLILMHPNLNEPQESSPRPDIVRFEMALAPDRLVQTESRGSLEYVTLRQKVIEKGLDALPLRQGVGGEPHTSRRQLLESMLSS